MHAYTPVFSYPKVDAMNLSEDEKRSFDMNDKDQVANFIQDAIEEICRGMREQPDRLGVRKIGLIIEGMLEDDFGANCCGLPYRDFVMGYVLDEGNWQRANAKHDRMVLALRELGLI